MFVRLLITIFIVFSTKVYAEDALEVEGAFLSEYCSEYFGMLNFRFENNTDEWVTIKEVNISFPEVKDTFVIDIVTGKSLISWHEATSTLIAENRFMSSLILGVLSGAGAAMIGKGGSQGIGGAVAIGSLGTLALKNISSVRTDIAALNLVPSSHLLHGEILVPPSLVADRWILLNTKDSKKTPYITEVVVEAKTDKGTRVNKKIILRTDQDRSCRWQSKLLKGNFGDF
ncbi:MAG: hypothetical protein OEZ47_15040 [Gammaproteobacteria bacterium]|nr:hypothetical protein [Gammaproteobacteria bacterium]